MSQLGLLRSPFISHLVLTVILHHKPRANATFSSVWSYAFGPSLWSATQTPLLVILTFGLAYGGLFL